MTKEKILRKLERREPLWDELPKVSTKILCGFEDEYGVAWLDDEPLIEEGDLPKVLPNGGQVYVDCQHVEYCTPEVGDWVAAVAYYEAGRVICQRENLSPRLYCHTNDWHGNTFAAHESYYTKAPREIWPRLVPYLISRMIFTGAGWFTSKPNAPFQISQRASFITTAVSQETTTNRAILNTRCEPLGNVDGYDRLHLICGDSTSCQVATGLRAGMTGLVLEMLELGALPVIKYNLDKTVSDCRTVSGSLENWFLDGVETGPKEVVEILSMYLDKARELFGGRDQPTDVVIIIMADTLEKLGSNPRRLSGRIDWVTKLELLELFASKESLADAAWLQSLDLEYHLFNPPNGLYLYLKKEGGVERIVSDSLINWTTLEPPSNTRAYARGKTVQLVNRHYPGLKVQPLRWNAIEIRRLFRNGKKVDLDLDHLDSDGEIIVNKNISNPFSPSLNELVQIANFLDYTARDNKV